MAVPFIDLTRQQAEIGRELEEAGLRVIRSGRYILGDELKRFEQEIGSYLGVKHAFGVSSGTDAVTLSLLASGLKPGDAVAVPSFTFFATVESVVHAGGVPFMIDIEERSFCMDPAYLERALGTADGRRVKAIVPVSLFGHGADIKAIRNAAPGIPVIEDACQAIGSSRDGVMSGAGATLGCFSFFPTKNLGACGDGGLVATNDDRLAERIQSLRNHGVQTKNVHSAFGFTARLDALQAALLRVKLRRLEAWNEKRRRNADYYGRALAAVAQVPQACEGTKHNFHQYTILVEDRETVRKRLIEEGVGCEVYYPMPVYRQEPLQGRAIMPLACPAAEHASAHCLSLPVFPELTEAERQTVVDQILRIKTSYRAVKA